MADETKETASTEAAPDPEIGKETAETAKEGGQPAEPAEEGKKPEEEAKPQGKPAKQSREDNAYYAEMRRAKKAEEERRRKAELDEARKQGALSERKKFVKPDELSALGLTQAESEDELYLVDRYREAQSKGEDNPVAYAYRSLSGLKSKALEDVRKRETEAEEASKAIREDAKSFAEKYGKTIPEAFKSDKGFADFFDKYGKRGNATECYADYLNLTGGSAKQDASEKAKDIAQSTPPKPNGKPTADKRTGRYNGFDTREEFLADFERKYGKFQ